MQVSCMLVHMEVSLHGDSKAKDKKEPITKEAHQTPKETNEEFHIDQEESDQTPPLEQKLSKT